MIGLFDFLTNTFVSWLVVLAGYLTTTFMFTLMIAILCGIPLYILRKNVLGYDKAFKTIFLVIALFIGFCSVPFYHYMNDKLAKEVVTK